PGRSTAASTAVRGAGGERKGEEARLKRRASSGFRSAPCPRSRDPIAFVPLTEVVMALRINSEAPNFTADTTQGKINFHEWIGDPELKTAKAYDMLPEDAGTTSQGRTAVDNATVRSVFIIGPDKKVKAMLTYPMSTGRNFDEVLRLLDSVQLTAKHRVATPA